MPVSISIVIYECLKQPGFSTECTIGMVKGMLFAKALTRITFLSAHILQRRKGLG